MRHRERAPAPPVAPIEAVRPRAWTAEAMAESRARRCEVPAAAEADVRAIEDLAVRQADPCAGLSASAVVTPALDALAGAMARALDFGVGMAWVRGLAGLLESTLRLVYLKLDLALGPTLDSYGRLYAVADAGESYRDKPIPVSQTWESTGMHTDSSSRGVRPGAIGLACVRQAPRGGHSRVASAAQGPRGAARKPPAAPGAALP